MSHRPFGYGRWDSYLYERAGPRMPGQGEKKYRHPVVRSSSTAVPHYAQASQLYPMRTSNEGENIYKYKPGSGSLGISSVSSPSSSSTGGQPVFIPVVHLGGSRGSSVSGDSNPGTPVPENSDTGGIRSPTFRTSSVVTTPGRIGGQRSTTNDPEAEVDALTNLLMQSMETRSSSSGLGSLSGSVTVPDGATSSPVGSLRRGSGPSTSIGLNSQIGRLQQHIGSSLNGGRGSPLTTNSGTLQAASTTGSSSTNSPTGSTSSIHNAASELGGSAGLTGTVISANSIQSPNTCFRCRRALIPPDGSTLNPSVSTANNSSNVVTLTGALSVRLHVACFTCYRCAAPLRPDAYYHSLRRLLCPACVRDGAVETCSNCRRPIGDRIVHALGLPYHPNCFVCVVCAGRLDSRPFTIDIHGRLHCLDDFHRRYAPRCAVCARPIAPEPGSQEARRVVSGDSNYHLECFGVQTISQPGGLGSKNGKLSAGVVG
ncbi:Lipoma-preferred partner protein [Fasciola hepatica]|uniref:Lipoma-preferred partner protein n=1 Tax=Fasciola hepatica TaxID=6192 RepID=A0A4E0RJD6_FASHE|nr:Lipoma-preferred partner protein [Fasciola hepatica]